MWGWTAQTAIALTALAMAGAARAEPVPIPQASDAAAALGLHVQDPSKRVGLAVEGPPTLNAGIIKPRDPLVTVDVRFSSAAQLLQNIASNNMSIDSGTVLYLAAFQTSAEASEPVAAWCGQGHYGPLRLRSTVCLV